MRKSISITVLGAVFVACSSGGSDSSTSSSSSGSSGSSSGGSSSTSSSSGGEPRTCNEVAATAAAFGAFCTVQSTVELTVLRPAPPMGWGGENDCLAAGATIYLASNGRGDLEGYAFVDSGTTPAHLWVAPVTPEMTAGQHYSGSCPPVAGVEPLKVVMRDANVYAAKELTGTPCMLTAGSELADFSFSNEEVNLVSVSGTGIQSACGFDRGYTNDLNVAALVKK